MLLLLLHSEGSLCFHSLLKSKHYFDKVSSHRDSEISAHSPRSLFQKELCSLYADSAILKKKAMSSTLPCNRESCSMTGQNQITQGSLHIGGKSRF